MIDQTTTVTKTNIEQLIFRLVKEYVRVRLKSKQSLEWNREWGITEEVNDEQKEIRKKSGYEVYAEKKEKVAKCAFLDVKSQSEKNDFINYFASALCSVPQPMKSEDYVNLTQSLYNDTDRVRILTLLALSANS